MELLSMNGYPYYFGVNDGAKVLKHPLYLKYNTLTLDEIIALDLGQGIKNLQAEISSIMLTNDNMHILQYLGNIIQAFRNVGAL